MAFTFQLDPELERRLVEQARLEGVSLENYIQEILERQTAIHRSEHELSDGVSLENYIQEILERQTAIHRSEHQLSDEEFEAELDALAAYSDKIPVLPLEALSRDEIYRDHD